MGEAVAVTGLTLPGNTCSGLEIKEADTSKNLPKGGIGEC
jgi:hypothetical protein